MISKFYIYTQGRFGHLVKGPNYEHLVPFRYILPMKYVSTS